MPYKFLIAFAFLFTLQLSIFGQTNEARKVDEFGVLPCREMVARAIRFEKEVARDKLNNAGFILVYEGNINGRNPKHGEAEAYERELVSVLNRNKPYIPLIMTYVKAGYKTKLTFELWVAKNNSEPFAPTSTLTEQDIKFRKGKPARPRNCLGEANYPD